MNYNEKYLKYKNKYKHHKLNIYGGATSVPDVMTPPSAFKVVKPSDVFIVRTNLKRSHVANIDATGKITFTHISSIPALKQATRDIVTTLLTKYHELKIQKIFRCTDGKPDDAITLFYGNMYKTRHCTGLPVLQVSRISARMLLYLWNYEHHTGAGTDCDKISESNIHNHLYENLLYILHTYSTDPEIQKLWLYDTVKHIINQNNTDLNALDILATLSDSPMIQDIPAYTGAIHIISGYKSDELLKVLASLSSFPDINKQSLYRDVKATLMHHTPKILDMLANQSSSSQTLLTELRDRVTDTIKTNQAKILNILANYPPSIETFRFPLYNELYRRVVNCVKSNLKETDWLHILARFSSLDRVQEHPVYKKIIDTFKRTRGLLLLPP